MWQSTRIGCASRSRGKSSGSHPTRPAPGRSRKLCARRQIGVEPAGVKITSARTRFGSCSGKNSLCFSLYLMEYPPDAIEAVVVHELAHIRHKNHGPGFYALIRQVMPDYDARIKTLQQ